MVLKEKNIADAKKTRFIVLTIVISLFLIYYTIMNMMGPARKLKEWKKEELAVKSDNPKSQESLFSDSTYLVLLRNKAWLQSRTLMAKTDSIYLTINLNDSTIDIGISGVDVHQTKINRYNISSIFLTGDEYTIISELSVPMNIVKSRATIKKEPVMIKMAPKDTSEYQPDIIPDTSLTKPVNFILNMSDGIRIYIYQDDYAKAGDRITQFLFDIRERMRDSWIALKSVALLKVPEYHPFIKLHINRDDAKIIYRAIPENGQIAVFL
jgi:hypothetical protein